MVCSSIQEEDTDRHPNLEFEFDLQGIETLLLIRVHIDRVVRLPYPIRAKIYPCENVWNKLVAKYGSRPISKPCQSSDKDDACGLPDVESSDGKSWLLGPLGIGRLLELGGQAANLRCFFVNQMKMPSAENLLSISTRLAGANLLR